MSEPNILGLSILSCYLPSNLMGSNMNSHLICPQKNHIFLGFLQTKVRQNLYKILRMHASQVKGHFYMKLV